MHKFLLIFVSLFVSTASFAGIIRCNKQADGERLTGFFCDCKTHLIVNFRADPGTFAAGEKIPVTIDGKSVGNMTLNMSGAKLAGVIDTKKKLPMPVISGSKIAVGDLICKLK